MQEETAMKNMHVASVNSNNVRKKKTKSSEWSVCHCMLWDDKFMIIIVVIMVGRMGLMSELKMPVNWNCSFAVFVQQHQQPQTMHKMLRQEKKMRNNKRIRYMITVKLIDGVHVQVKRWILLLPQLIIWSRARARLLSLLLSSFDA